MRAQLPLMNQKIHRFQGVFNKHFPEYVPEANTTNIGVSDISNPNISPIIAMAIFTKVTLKLLDKI